MSYSKLPSSLTARQLLAGLTKLTSTYSGLDASLMLVQYSSPLVIALLLRLAALKTRIGIRGKGGSGFGLRQLAEGWGKMGGSIGEARVVFRAFGLLPILTWLLSLHPHPIESLKSLLQSGHLPSLDSPKTFSTLQAISLLLYYPLEHLTWLGGKGVIPLNEKRMGWTGLWSVRFWALYVLLDIYKLRQTYLSLLTRTKSLKQSQSAKPKLNLTEKHEEAKGFELPPSPSSPTHQNVTSSSDKQLNLVDEKKDDRVREKEVLKHDWKVWKNDVMINTGYAPLTVHWSTPGGLWSSPLIGGSLGVVAAVGRLTAEWTKGEQ
ncbi:hypothetical protein I203_104822 [Kwoniella mangroviensis CBS 8507]|uniref:uncharacterized protein n=1 Tax=Kwoniella mangroviensis CBS 8507 TaxID=1296122 RepID=UPI00080D1F6E|nr:uncharacterized protein I203_00236 [Kwoniella mangroviensis CBS 8507]OCF70105.1 hypothetical protein I203_00236 [Kwoniella mangroviensis CBS 8507]